MKSRWLLPSVLRGAVVFVALISASLLLLARIGHYGSTQRSAVLVAICVGALVLAFIPARPVAPARRASAVVESVNAPPAGAIRWDLVDSGIGSMRPATPGAERAQTQGEEDTEPIPVYHDPTIVDFDDFDFAALSDSVEFDRVDLIGLSEPSNLVRQYLFPTEKFRGEWRRHWIQLAREMVVIVLLALLLQSGQSAHIGSYEVDLADIPRADLVSQLGLAFLILWRGTAWHYNRFVLTNKRLMLIKGSLWRRVATLPLARATSVVYNSSLLGRILGYGVFRFSGVSLLHPLMRVADLPNPTDLYLQVVEEMYEPEAAEARRRPARIDDHL